MNIKVKKLDPRAILPEFQSKNAAGADIYCLNAVAVPPGEYRKVNTGIAVAIPHGFEIQVRPRSGLAANSAMTVLNSPGTIDSDYRGEIVVLLMNHGKDVFSCKAGTRIAQLVVSRVPHSTYVEVSELDTTDRGEGGFGSTGLH